MRNGYRGSYIHNLMQDTEKVIAFDQEVLS